MTPYQRLAAKQARHTELASQREELRGSIAELREAIGRAVAEGQDAGGMHRQLRNAGDELDGLERAIGHVEGEITDLRGTVQQEDLERARAVLQQVHGDHDSTLAELYEMVVTDLAERLLPKLASLADCAHQVTAAERDLRAAARAAGAGDPWETDPALRWRQDRAWAAKAPGLQDFLRHVRAFAERLQITPRATPQDTPQSRGRRDRHVRSAAT